MQDSIFPLALTPWEELFIVDDHDNYPANFMTRIRCLGKLPGDLLQESLLNCQRRHPLFDCKIRKSSGMFRWVRETSNTLPVELDSWSPGKPDFPLQKKFDVLSEKLWRIKVVEFEDAKGNQRTDIFVEMHHALCDGLGAIQFMSDVASEIHRLHGKSKTENNREIDMVALESRGRFSRSWKEVFRGLPHHYRSIWASLQLIFTKIEPLVPVDSVKKLLVTKKQKLGYRKFSFSARLSSQLRRHCRMQNTTLNSVVAAKLFRCIYEWKIEQGHAMNKSLRVMIPFNERGLNDRRLPACNRVSLSPFTRSLGKNVNFEALLTSIEQGVRVVKKGRLGLNFHRGLWVCKTLFGNLKMFAKTDRVGATCVFSNIGNIHVQLGLPLEGNNTRCGPVLIEDIDLVPPLRIGTSFAMILHEFNGETRMGIHFDSAMISDQEVDSFFGYFVDCIAQLPETSMPETPMPETPTSSASGGSEL